MQWQLVQYPPGGIFDEHLDEWGFDASGVNAPMPLTLMVYLNSPSDGGGTRFPQARAGRGLVVPARKGDLLVWSSCDSRGGTDPRTLHGGVPAVAGDKWILNRSSCTAHRTLCRTALRRAPHSALHRAAPRFYDTQYISLEACRASGGITPDFGALTYTYAL